MKKVYSIFLLTCVMLLTLVSCQKDSVTLKVRISTFSSPDKTYMEPVTNGCMPRWQIGDGVWINGISSYTVTVSGQNASIADVLASAEYRAIYPSSIVRGENDVNSSSIAIELPRVQNYNELGGYQVVEAPMGASSHGNTLDFTNMGALLAIRILNNTNPSLNRSASLDIDSIVVTSVTENTPLWGAGIVQNINADSRSYVMAPTDINNIEKYYTVSLGGINGSVSAGRSTNVNDAKVLYMYIPASTGTVQNRFEVKVHAHNARYGSFVYTRTQTVNGQGNIGLNHVACVPMDLGASDCVEEFTPNALPEGAIDAMYSVAPGVQVHFSCGNLVYNTRANVFKFAEHQYDVIGDVYNGSDTTVHPEEFDLFGWGTSGTTDGDPYTTHYSPYSIVANQVSGISTTYNAYGYGPSTNNANYQLTTNYVFDWGSRISTTDHWRSLSMLEWYYLFKKRWTGDESKSHRTCSIEIEESGDLVLGMVIFPDNFTGQESLRLRGDNGALRLDVNGDPIYSSSDIDRYGIVFLPSTGMRISQTIDNVKSITKYQNGFGYWTGSTGSFIPTTETFSGKNKSTAYYFNTTSFSASNRYMGYAVRLAIDCE